MLLVTRGIRRHEEMSKLLSYSPKLLEKQSDIFPINKISILQEVEYFKK